MATAATQATPAYTADFKDLSLIYGDEFQFSLPKSILESYYSGKAFDHNVLYTDEEKGAADLDIKAICSSLFEGLSSLEPKEVVISAGAPGSGKTVLMESMLTKANADGKRFAYIDPDAVCLKTQKETYLKDVRQDQTHKARKDAYDKWRPLANFIANVALAHLIKSGSSFYYGTTASSPATKFFLEFLQKHGYKITIIHLTATDETRVASIHERDKEFIQTTDQDIKQKGKLFPERINDTYLKYADRIEFHSREAVNKNAVLAATWEKKEGGKGALSIQSQDLYKEIAKVHNAVLGEGNFEKSLEEASTKLAKP